MLGQEVPIEVLRGSWTVYFQETHLVFVRFLRLLVARGALESRPVCLLLIRYR